MNNIRIRAKLMEKGKRYWWLAQIMGISENTLFRRLRNELPEDEQERICKLIDEYAERGGQES